jgi:hypothetical protein
MNNNRINIFLITLIISLPFCVYAGGSSYSRYGFGDVMRYGDSRIYAMGGTGIALLDDGFINGLNPAGLTHILFTRFSGGFEYDRFSSKDENGSALYSVAGFQGLAFAFPISRENGIVMSAEMTPYSKVNYAISNSYFDAVANAQTNKVLYGNGGLSSLCIGLSASLYTDVHIGARLIICMDVCNSIKRLHLTILTLVLQLLIAQLIFPDLHLH